MRVARLGSGGLDATLAQQFRTQAEYYLQLAELAVSPEDRVQLITIACVWHSWPRKIDVQRS
jgi:hypothetical protein